MSTTTHHTCGGPTFGRRTPGCPRCEELQNGASPIQWAGTRRENRDKASAAALRAHNCTKSRCGPVCTFGDW